jgi:hypothetical protein
MAYPVGFTYVSGPLFIREFNLTSTTTVKGIQPVMISGAGTIIESLATSQTLAGFILHDAVNSVPAGKCLVAVPADGRTIWASIVTTGVAASALSSGATLGMAKSGNSWYLTGSPTTAIFVVVPREDGSTIDSTDSSIFVQVIGQQVRPFALAAPTQVI